MSQTLRYRLGAAVALGLTVYATVFARQTHNFVDLPTWIDVTEWPVTLLYAGAALLSLIGRPRASAFALVAGTVGFFAAQSDHFFAVPLAFMLVTVVTLAFIFILPSEWEGDA